MISTSMGPIYDRSTEHLVAADAAIVRLRQRLLDSVRLSEEGKDPLGVDYEDMTHMIGFDRDIGEADSWKPYAAHNTSRYSAQD